VKNNREIPTEDRVPDRTNEKLLIGARERCRLPDIALGTLVARVDTGAKTSSLHIDEAEPFDRDGEPWVRVTLRRRNHRQGTSMVAELPVHDQRVVKSSNGSRETRYVVTTTLRMSDREWPIEITLTNRAQMRSSLLLGREALRGRVLIDPDREFMLGRPTTKRRR
jgi:ribosomal protein S6--L-glutamate ligase